MKNCRNYFIVIIALVVAMSGCAAPASTSNPTLTPRPQITLTPKEDVVVLPRENRPNIVLILLDDLDADLDSTDYMPAFQELLVEPGLTIESFYVSTSVCCPSRATILRGQFSHNHGVLNNSPPFGGFERFYLRENESSTVATWLQAAGYKTALFGKYLNGYPFRENRNYMPIGWTEWYSPAKGKPYVGFEYTLNQNGVQVDYHDQGEGQSLYLTDVLSAKAVEFIRRSSEDDSAFFVFLSLFAPHQPATPARRHENLFSDLMAPRTPSFNESDVSDKTGAIQFNTLLTKDQIADMDELYRERIRTLQSVDELIAQLIRTLDETGELDNTYVIFTSDNGFHLGQHRLYSGKGTLFEEDIHVPFVIRGPGIPESEVLQGYLAGNVDIAPTIADMAGIVPPDYVDGRSLMPLFSDQPPALDKWRSAFFLEVHGQSNEEDSENETPLLVLNSSYGLRTVRYLYVEHQDAVTELYDMQNDPFQLQNIAPSADPSLLDEFSKLLYMLQECSGNECLILDETKLNE